MYSDLSSGSLLIWLVCQCSGVESILVSSGDVVEVEHDEDGNAHLQDNWCDNHTTVLGENFFAVFLADIWSTVGEDAGDDEDADDDLEDRVDEELESHPLDKLVGSLLSVLLEPQEPLP